MQSRGVLSRRAFLALAGVSPFIAPLSSPFAALRASAAASKIPVGLELYSVRTGLKADPMGTVRAVAKLGYEVVEFYAPYYDWTPQQASDMRKLLDDLGIRCKSTHNGPVSFTPGGIQKAIDLNQAIGSTLIVMASPGGDMSNGADSWKDVADRLSSAAERLKAVGMSAGYHNHNVEWRKLPDGGQRPMDILATNTHENVVLQLDVGTCVEEGQDPVGWINAHPGRIKSMHCKDWARGESKGYNVVFGEGDVQWPPIFKAAESVGGIETYLIEQEQGAGTELERVERCLANWKKLRA